MMENKVSDIPESCENVNEEDNILQISSDCLSEKESNSEVGGLQHHAALKLQKVYKSFRTRRQLADCAVLVEQKWWRLLDFLELRRSSISFFELEKPESTVSRWFRARRRAARVGQGLSKDEKARKLALQHWLEAIDPRHRYGHNLQFYYARWLHCESKQPFFYWLDIGEGKEVQLENCPRLKLQHQCIKYLGPAEREKYEVVVSNEKLVYKLCGELLDTTGGPEDVKWIFVLSAWKKLYVGQKKKGTFQHSSFLAGGATLSAGRLVVEDGILKAVWPHSGHYLPTEENFQEFISFLRKHNVDLTNVKKSPPKEEEIISKKNIETTVGGSEQTEATNDENSTDQENTGSRKEDVDAEQNDNKLMTRLSRLLLSKLRSLKTQKIHDAIEIIKTNTLSPSWRNENQSSPCKDDGYETAEEFLSEEQFEITKTNLFGEDDDEEEEEEEEDKPIPKEKIMRRIDSHKGMKSYQLAQQLSSKWSTGAGPRISCMRDYPSELQSRVLEQANLTPKARNANVSPRSTSHFSPTVLSPTSLWVPLDRQLPPVQSV